MKTFKTHWTTKYTDATIDPSTIDPATTHDFIKYLVQEFAKLDLHGKFDLPKGYEGRVVVFVDSKQQFLYELRGGSALYKRLREEYLQWQEELLMQSMAAEIQKEIDRDILENLMKEAELLELEKSIKRID